MDDVIQSQNESLDGTEFLTPEQRLELIAELLAEMAGNEMADTPPLPW